MRGCDNPPPRVIPAKIFIGKVAVSLTTFTGWIHGNE
jgi:hypothetical protein